MPICTASPRTQDPQIDNILSQDFWELPCGPRVKSLRILGIISLNQELFILVDLELNPYIFGLFQYTV